jgi:hypothetical protein
MHEDKWEGLSCSYIDKGNNIWVGFDFGEWGGKLFIFDTNKKTFVPPSLADMEERLYPVESFSEDSKSVYVSAAMNHMMTSGSISRFENFRETLLFASKGQWSEPVQTNTGSERYIIDGEAVHSIRFNPYDNALYFASQNGIFRGMPTDNLSDPKKWQQIATTNARFLKSLPEVALVPHNIIKIAAVKKNTLVFLSQFDGIGILENGHVTMLK